MKLLQRKKKKRSKMRWRHKRRDKDCVKTNLAFEKFVARDTVDDTASCMDYVLAKKGWTDELRWKKMFNHHQTNGNNTPIYFYCIRLTTKCNCICHSWNSFFICTPHDWWLVILQWLFIQKLCIWSSNEMVFALLPLFGPAR